MKIEITKDEQKYIQGCVNDSASEGNFSHLFQEIDVNECEKNLMQKGLIRDPYDEI